MISVPFTLVAMLNVIAGVLRLVNVKPGSFRHWLRIGFLIIIDLTEHIGDLFMDEREKRCLLVKLIQIIIATKVILVWHLHQHHTRLGHVSFHRAPKPANLPERP